MVTGIDASITSMTDGTTAHAADVIASLNSLNINGVSNDSGLITTDNAGKITAVGFSATNGGTLTYFVTPVLVRSNITINQNSVDTATYTGSGGIPSGAKAIWLSFAFTTAAIGAHAQFTPSGVGIADAEYPQSDPRQTSSSTVTKGSFLVKCDASGQIDIRAINGQITACYVRAFGYQI